MPLTRALVILAGLAAPAAADQLVVHCQPVHAVARTDDAICPVACAGSMNLPPVGLACDKFPASLGTLNSITVSYQACGSGTLSWQKVAGSIGGYAGNCRFNDRLSGPGISPALPAVLAFPDCGTGIGSTVFSGQCGWSTQCASSAQHSVPPSSFGAYTGAGQVGVTLNMQLAWELAASGVSLLYHYDAVTDVDVSVTYDYTPPCYANCDGSTVTPILNVNDFVCFQTRFAAGDPGANCDGSTIVPVLNVNDFICFQTRFAQGCP